MFEDDTLGFKVDYLYGLASPNKQNLYEDISDYVFANKLIEEDIIEDTFDHRVLKAFFTKIETLSGFEDLDHEGAWGPDSKNSMFILVFAKDSVPTDKDVVEKIKRAVEAVKKELKIEAKAKWYVGDNDEFDEVGFLETGKFNTPPCFT